MEWSFGLWTLGAALVAVEGAAVHKEADLGLQIGEGGFDRVGSSVQELEFVHPNPQVSNFS